MARCSRHRIRQGGFGGVVSRKRDLHWKRLEGVTRGREPARQSSGVACSHKTPRQSHSSISSAQRHNHRSGDQHLRQPIPVTTQRSSETPGSAMRKLLTLCLGVLALATLLPTQIYCQNTTTSPTVGSHAASSAGGSVANMTSVTPLTHNANTTKGHGNLIHASSGLFVIVISTSLLYVC